VTEIVGSIAYTVTADTTALVNQSRAVDRETAGMARSFSVITVAIAAYGAALAAVKTAQMADEMRLLAARIDVAAGSATAGAAALRDLAAMSLRTQTSVAANAQVFQRLNQSLIQMGGTQADTLRVTELLGMAVKVSGASAQESASAMLQFGQALGSGKLAGDELRSLMENAPYLMKQLADGIGVPVGALKSLGEEGKLTADVVVNALGKAAAKITDDFAKMPQTLGSAFQVAQDQMARLILAMDEASGKSTVLTGVTRGVGEAFDALAKQIDAASGKATDLEKNDSIKTWADRSKIAVSYVVDAFDWAAQRLERIWNTTKLLNMLLSKPFVALANNDGGGFYGSAVKAKREQPSAEPQSNAMTAGERMRAQWDTEEWSGPNAGPARGKSKADSKLKAPPGEAKKKNEKTDRSSEQAWEAEKKIIEEQDALTIKFYADQQKRLEDANDKTNAENVQQIQTEEKNAAARKKIQDEASQFSATATRAVNPLDAMRQEYEAKLEMVTQYETMMADAGVLAFDQGQIARTELETLYNQQRLAMAEQSFRAQGEGNAFLIDSINSMAQASTGVIMGLLEGTQNGSDAMRAFGKIIISEGVSALVQMGLQQIKNALLGDTVEAAARARSVANGAIYATSITAQVAGMAAIAGQNAFAATAAIPVVGPGLAAAAATSAITAASAIGATAIATAPVAGARQYGGPASAGSLYRVNEGGRPEMFTASNGAQYMMPTADGRVTPSGAAGSASGWTIIVNNNASGTVVSEPQVDDQARTIRLAVSEVAGQIASNQGPVWSAMRNATSVKGRING
jgi:tape measure domain-containing protein